MHETFFGLRSRPFAAAPLPNRFFPASSIDDARQLLSRCIERAEGLGLVVAGPGMGKTLLLQVLAQQFSGRFTAVFLSTGRIGTRKELLQAILFELKLPCRGMDEGEMRIALLERLHDADHYPGGLILLVDEAHTLPVSLLHELRVLSDVWHQGEPRVRLLLAGDLKLEEQLALPELEALSQRITARCYLEPFDRAETADFIRFQIAAAGGRPEDVLHGLAIDDIHRAADGIPRLVNQLCDQTLLLAARRGCKPATHLHVQEAWSLLQQLPSPLHEQWSRKAGSVPGSATIEFGELRDDDVTFFETGAPNPEAAPNEDQPRADHPREDQPRADHPREDHPRADQPQVQAATSPPAEASCDSAASECRTTSEGEASAERFAGDDEYDVGPENAGQSHRAMHGSHARAHEDADDLDDAEHARRPAANEWLDPTPSADAEQMLDALEAHVKELAAETSAATRARAAIPEADPFADFGDAEVLHDRYSALEMKSKKTDAGKTDAAKADGGKAAAPGSEGRGAGAKKEAAEPVRRVEVVETSREQVTREVRVDEVRVEEIGGEEVRAAGRRADERRAEEPRPRPSATASESPVRDPAAADDACQGLILAHCETGASEYVIDPYAGLDVELDAEPAVEPVDFPGDDEAQSLPSTVAFSLPEHGPAAACTTGEGDEVGLGDKQAEQVGDHGAGHDTRDKTEHTTDHEAENETDDDLPAAAAVPPRAFRGQPTPLAIEDDPPGHEEVRLPMMTLAEAMRRRLAANAAHGLPLQEDPLTARESSSRQQRSTEAPAPKSERPAQIGEKPGKPAGQPSSAEPRNLPASEVFEISDDQLLVIEDEGDAEAETPSRSAAELQNYRDLFARLKRS